MDSRSPSSVSLSSHFQHHSIAGAGKLKFLSRVMVTEDSVSRGAFCSLVDDTESLCLVKECRELEERYGVDYTSKILTSKPEDRQHIMKDLSRAIQKEDLALQLQSASDMEHLCKIAVEVRRWDLALDHGISSLRNLVRCH